MTKPISLVCWHELASTPRTLTASLSKLEIAEVCEDMLQQHEALLVAIEAARADAVCLLNRASGVSDCQNV